MKTVPIVLTVDRGQIQIHLETHLEIILVNLEIPEIPETGLENLVTQAITIPAENQLHQFLIFIRLRWVILLMPRQVRNF